MISTISEITELCIIVDFLPKIDLKWNLRRPISYVLDILVKSKFYSCLIYFYVSVSVNSTERATMHSAYQIFSILDYLKLEKKITISIFSLVRFSTYFVIMPHLFKY